MAYSGRGRSILAAMHATARGMGYMWESDIHVYLKRAVLNRSLFGSPTSHRRWLAARYRG